MDQTEEQEEYNQQKTKGNQGLENKVQNLTDKFHGMDEKLNTLTNLIAVIAAQAREGKPKIGTGRFLFTALFVIMNNILKKCHHLIHLFFKKEKNFQQKKLNQSFTESYNHIKGNTSSFGCAIQVLPSDIRKYFSSFFISAVAVVISFFISPIENCIFFMDVNSYVGKKKLT